MRLAPDAGVSVVQLGELNCLLVQDKGKGSSLSPSKTLPWKYGSYSNGLWMDDNTLKVFPCY